MTYNPGGFQFESVYPAQSVPGKHRNCYRQECSQSTLTALLLSLNCTSSVSAEPIDFGVLICEDRMEKGEPKWKKRVCVAFKIWWV